MGSPWVMTHQVSRMGTPYATTVMGIPTLGTPMKRSWHAHELPRRAFFEVP